MLFLIVFLVATPVVTYVLSLIRFNIRVRKSAGLAPSVPYTLPLIAHTPTFASGSEALADLLRKNAIPGAAVRFKGLGFNFVLLSGGAFIRKALIASNHFDWNAISAPLFGGMFGGSERLVDALRQDDSGIGIKPYPGSNVHPGRRLLRNQVLFFSDAFSRSSLDEIVPRFIESLQDWCADPAQSIDSEWVDMPDLFEFIRDILFMCGVEAIFGKSLLGLNPDLIKDFWEYDDNISFLATPMPRWIRPNAERARDKCVFAMKRWRQNAIKESDPSVAEYAAWDPAWGLGAIRRRNKLFDATEGLFDDNDRASTDLALLWSLSSNVIPASFWYLVEVLASKDLLARTQQAIKTELEHITDGTLPQFDSAKLTNNAVLQAIYAETLRLHVATLLTRTVKKEHSVDSWILPKNQNIIVSSHVEHMHDQWNSTVSGKTHPPSEFWPDRFLVEESDMSGHDTKFSLDGRQGQWIPFGLGEHMCPGRHFAKQEMILNCVILLTMFDFELKTEAGWRPSNDFGRYGFGSQQPKEKTPFRIRRRRMV